jgi:hypothetical protein
MEDAGLLDGADDRAYDAAVAERNQARARQRDFNVRAATGRETGALIPRTHCAAFPPSPIPPQSFYRDGVAEGSTSATGLQAGFDAGYTSSFALGEAVTCVQTLLRGIAAVAAAASSSSRPAGAGCAGGGGGGGAPAVVDEVLSPVQLARGLADELEAAGVVAFRSLTVRGAEGGGAKPQPQSSSPAAAAAAPPPPAASSAGEGGGAGRPPRSIPLDGAAEGLRRITARVRGSWEGLAGGLRTRTGGGDDEDDQGGAARRPFAERCEPEIMRALEEALRVLDAECGKLGAAEEGHPKHTP